MWGLSTSQTFVFHTTSVFPSITRQTAATPWYIPPVKRDLSCPFKFLGPSFLIRHPSPPVGEILQQQKNNADGRLGGPSFTVVKQMAPQGRRAQGLSHERDKCKQRDKPGDGAMAGGATGVKTNIRHFGRSCKGGISFPNCDKSFGNIQRLSCKMKRKQQRQSCLAGSPHCYSLIRQASRQLWQAPTRPAYALCVWT